MHGVDHVGLGVALSPLLRFDLPPVTASVLGVGDLPSEACLL